MDDKKKLMVLGAMGVVLLGIGAFQFVKSSGSQAPAPAPKAEVSKAAPTDGADTNGNNSGDILAPGQNDLVKGAYAYRDPFKPLVDSNARPASNPMQTPTPTPKPRNEGIPNFPGIDTSGGLPSPNATGGTVTPVKPQAPAFGFNLAGVIMGKRPAAVFIDAQGAQHLVQLGGSLDGDTQLVDLDRDHVVLRVKGQTKTLTLGGGDTSAK
jgi:hypothetical protein